MFPFAADNPSRQFPIMTVTLIVLNVLMFILHYLIVPDPRAFTLMWALIPAQVTSTPFAPDVFVDFFSSMFMHGDLAHIGGNMLYLWIFGDNVEDTLGHIGFVAFYLVTGIAAALTHIALGLPSTIPTLGASGAISGVLGAYLLLFPRARVRTAIFMFRFFTVRELPALFVLGFWFVYQVALGFLSLGSEGGGVAYGAHVGGFVAGFLLMLVLRYLQGEDALRDFTRQF
ncbi:MAG: rhomboid family intramembrane serine protease [Anaerolineae bacterium]